MCGLAYVLGHSGIQFSSKLFRRVVLYLPGNMPEAASDVHACRRGGRRAAALHVTAAWLLVPPRRRMSLSASAPSRAAGGPAG